MEDAAWLLGLAAELRAASATLRADAAETRRRSVEIGAEAQRLLQPRQLERRPTSIAGVGLSEFRGQA